MALLKGQAKITLANEGSIIRMDDLSPAMRAAYMKQSFKLNDQPNYSPQRARQEQNMPILQGENKEEASSPFMPKPEDLVRVPFRAITATMVAAGSWRATDFTDTDVLRRSLLKLVGKTAFTEHRQYSSNQIGTVESAMWDEGGRVVNGQKIPPGINVVYLIDGKMNEKLARGLLMTPPAIYSNSVTVEFMWESTHDHFEDENDFLRNLGKVQADGRMAARKVTDIVDYHESSILWLGADPFAKMLDKDGNPVNVDHGSVFEQASSYAKDLYTNDKKYFVACSFNREGIYLNPDTSSIPNEDPTKNPMEKILIELARKLLNLPENEEVTQAHIDSIQLVKKDEQTSLLADRSSFNALKTDGVTKEAFDALKLAKGTLEAKNTELDGKVTTLTAEVAAKEELAKVGESYLNAKRDEVTRLYKLQMGANADEAVLTLIKEAKDMKAVDGLLAQYTKGVKEKFEASCTSCKSTDISFRSSLTTDEPESVHEDDAKFREDFKNSI